MKTIGDYPTSEIRTAYALNELLAEKVLRVAQNVYGADGVNFGDEAKAKLEQFTAWGYGRLPVCIAKTQYSFTDDPKRMGAPTGWRLNVTNASLSAGAGFVVVISGNMMLMPGLPKVSRVASMDVDEQGRIVGI